MVVVIVTLNIQNCLDNISVTIYNSLWLTGTIGHHAAVPGEAVPPWVVSDGVSLRGVWYTSPGTHTNKEEDKQLVHSGTKVFLFKILKDLDEMFQAWSSWLLTGLISSMNIISYLWLSTVLQSGFGKGGGGALYQKKHLLILNVTNLIAYKVFVFLTKSIWIFYICKWG